MSRQRTSRDADMNTRVMGTEMNPYIVDMPTRFSFFGKSKKKKEAYSEKEMESSQIALEEAARKAMTVVSKGMIKANAELERDERELQIVVAKHALSTQRHQELLDKTQNYKNLLGHVKDQNVSENAGDGDGDGDT
jgi:hypothetical protein